MAINLNSPSAFTSGTLVADTVATSGGSSDSISKMTTAGGVTVSAALEVQSIEGALLIPRMTTAQRDALTASNGMEIYNTTTDAWNFYVSGAWTTIAGGSGTVTNVATGTGLTGGPITAAGTIVMADTAVTPGSYTSSNITVDAQGRLTAASSGAAADVTGPASSTDGCVSRFDGVSGKLLKEGTVCIADTTGDTTGLGSLHADLTGVGSESSPSYSFTGNTNAGMYSSASNVLDFSTNSLRVLQIKAGIPLSVDYLSLQSSATNAGNEALQPSVLAEGSDTNIDVGIVGKGAGGLAVLPSSTGVAGLIKLWEGIGGDYVGLQAGSIVSSLTFTLPVADFVVNPTAGAIESFAPMSTNGSGVLGFDSNLVSFTSVSVNAAGVTGMFATPFTIIPAQGADQVVVVHKVMVEIDFGSAVFTGGGASYLLYGTTGAGSAVASDTIPATFIQQGGDFVISKEGVVGSTNGLALGTALINEPLTITNDTGAFAAGGTSRLVVNVWYSVINYV